MSRRKFREEKSKFYGTKQVLQDLNQTAHQIVHDTDVALAAGGGTGYTIVWSSGTVLRSTDVSAPIFVPSAGTLFKVYASLPFDALDTYEVDVYKNGSTVFTTAANRPKVTVGNKVSANATPNITAVLAGDSFQVVTLATGGNPGRAMVYIVVT